MDNYNKATRIVELHIKKDYGGDKAAFESENGKLADVVDKIFFWLEDGNGDELNDEMCLSIWTLQQRG